MPTPEKDPRDESEHHETESRSQVRRPSSQWFFVMPYRRRKPTTFDELWRLDLDRDGARGDSVDKAEAVGLIAVPGENPNELLLTAGDGVFLSEVGIRP